MRREARAVYSPRGSLGGAAKYQVWPVIPANAGIQGVVGLFLCASAQSRRRSLTTTNGRVVAHWIPAFAGMTA